MYSVKKIGFMLFSALIIFTGCDSSNPAGNDDNNGTVTATGKMLVIPTGAQSVKIGSGSRGVSSYEAKMVDSDGNSAEASVTWSSTDEDVASISASGSITINGAGATTIKASASVDGKTYEASVPLTIYFPSLWIVSPSAIVGTEGDSHDLEVVLYSLGNTGLTYTYSSENSNIASVSSDGTVTLKSAGNTVITVSDNKQNSFAIPVVVAGIPEVVLPVAKLTITPGNKTMFRNDEYQFSAEAENSDGEVVTADIIWSSRDESIATVDASGKVKAVALGETEIIAMADGIPATASVVVYPDTIIVIDPFLVEKAAGETQQMSAKAYSAKTETELTGITNFTWYIPSWSELHSSLSMLDVATINGSGLVKVKDDAMAGLPTFIFAGIEGSDAMGVAALIVGTGFGDIPDDFPEL